ncbi:MAG: hypothetical protein WCC63_07560, partial [Candidatus Bathyarchaeia archaeon]
ALSRLLVYPRTEYFTELWLLGPSHTAEDYPFNITRGNSYSIFLGIRNWLSYCAYYSVQVKFRDQNQSAPTSFGPTGNPTPSTLASLFNLTAFVADEGVLELPLTFSFGYALNETISEVKVYSMTLNGALLDISGSSLVWNSNKKGYAGNLFFEAWLYNASTGSFQYHERSVGLWLNMTV